jgi:hypothetical protein
MTLGPSQVLVISLMSWLLYAQGKGPHYIILRLYKASNKQSKIKSHKNYPVFIV